MVSDEERRRTAYHEAGHVLMGMLTPGADPVRRLSIVPRGHALGVTFQSPDTDRYFYIETCLRDRIAGLLGGRAAEQLVYDDLTTGRKRPGAGHGAGPPDGRPLGHVRDDRSDVGAARPAAREPLSLDGNATSRHREFVAAVAVGQILDDCARQAVDLLARERSRLEAVVAALLQHETLDTADIYRASDLRVPHRTGPPRTVASLSA